MANNNLIASLRTTLGINSDADKYWHIIDQDDDKELYSIHYYSELIPELIKSDIDTLSKSRIFELRGIIVYLPVNNNGSYPTNGTIVTRGFGYTPTCTVDRPLKIVDNQLSLVDNQGGQHIIDMKDNSETKAVTGYDGCVLRLSKFNDEVLLTTGRRIDVSKSFWGDSDFFPVIYEKLGGPIPKTLFSDKPHSNITHLFMLVHPSLSVGSRLNIGDGYLVYLGNQYNNHSLTNNPISLPDDFETEPFLKNIDIYNIGIIGSDGKKHAPYREPSKKDEKTMIISPTYLDASDVDVWNTILMSGASPYSPSDFLDVDPRLTQGETLICTYTSVSGHKRMIRISPVASNWRVAIMDNNPNRYNQFVRDYTYTLSQKLEVVPTDSGDDWSKIFNGISKKIYTYDQLFPLVATPTLEELKRLKTELLEATTFELPCTMPDYFTSKSLDDQDLKLRNIASCFILATPPSHIIDSIGFYENFITQRNLVISELVDNFLKYKAIPNKTGVIDRVNWGLIDNEVNDSKGEKLSQLKLPKNDDGKDAIQIFSKKTKDGSYKLNLAGIRLVNIFTEAVKHATKVQPKTKDGHPKSLLAVCRNNINNLLIREHGESLYSIMTAVTKYIKYKSSISK